MGNWPAVAHHDSSALYVAPTHPAVGDPVVLRVGTDPAAEVQAVFVRSVDNGEPHHHPLQRAGLDELGQWWQVELTMPNPSMTYRFLLDLPGGAQYLTQAGLVGREVPDAHDFRLLAHGQAPQWAVDGVVYQVFCDRFAPGGVELPDPLPAWVVPASWDTPVAANTPDGVRQLYGGTLWGIRDHLDHLVELGVDVLYLTPFFPANSNHRYDSTTFEHVDPFLGGDEALRALCSSARERGIRVIGDLTLNHTGVEHEWFRAALADRRGAEAGFYLFEETADGLGYDCFWGVPSLPRLDHRNAELRRRLYDGPDSVVARYVRDFGLSGWRIDVAHAAGIHREVDLNAQVAQLTRRTLDELARHSGEQYYLVAEVNHDPSRGLQGDGWQATMAYAGFTRPVWSWLGGAVEAQWGVPIRLAQGGGAALVDQVTDFGATIPWDSRLAGLNLLDSHDTARFRTAGGATRRGWVLRSWWRCPASRWSSPATSSALRAAGWRIPVVPSRGPASATRRCSPGTAACSRCAASTRR